MVANDLVDSAVSGLMHRLKQFGVVQGQHATATSQAKMNGNFIQNDYCEEESQFFHTLSHKIKSSCIQFASFDITPTV